MELDVDFDTITAIMYRWLGQWPSLRFFALPRQQESHCNPRSAQGQVSHWTRGQVTAGHFTGSQSPTEMQSTDLQCKRGTTFWRVQSISPGRTNSIPHVEFRQGRISRI